MAEVTTPLLPKFEDIEYEIGFLDALESIIQEPASSKESCNITSKSISTFYILTLLVNKSVDGKRLSSMQDNILSSIETMFQYQGENVNDIFSWKLLMKLKVDLWLKLGQKRDIENINALKKSLILLNPFSYERQCFQQQPFARYLSPQTIYVTYSQDLKIKKI